MCDTFSGWEGFVMSVMRSCEICYFEKRVREGRKEVKGLSFRSFETTKTREVQKKHDEPVKITDLIKVTSEPRASLSSPRNFGTFYHYQLIILKL